MAKEIYVILEKLAKFVFLILTIFLILTYLFSLPIGLYLLLFTNDGISISELTLDSIPTSLFIFFNFMIPISINKGILFSALITIYAVCFIMAWFFYIKLHSLMKDIISIPMKKILNNFLLSMPLFSSALLLIVVAVQSIQEFYGVETGSISFQNQFEGLFLLSYSPILEELSYRITPIGLILLILILVKFFRKENPISLSICALCFIYPDKAKEKANLETIHDKGFKKGISYPEWIMLFLTSIFFGINHYLPGGSWGIGKITSATLAGLVFALSYLYFGVHAPILLHWSFNYYMYAYQVLAENYDTVFTFLVDLNQFIIIILGSFGILGLIFLISNRLRVMEIKTKLFLKIFHVK